MHEWCGISQVPSVAMKTKMPIFSRVASETLLVFLRYYSAHTNIYNIYIFRHFFQ